MRYVEDGKGKASTSDGRRGHGTSMNRRGREEVNVYLAIPVGRGPIGAGGGACAW